MIRIRTARVPELEARLSVCAGWLKRGRLL